MLGEIALILGLLVLSAFFSASETALTALSPIRNQRLIDGEHWYSKALIMWRDKPLMVLTAILIGNNIVNITASAVATEIAHDIVGPESTAAIPFAVGVMTLLILTFGEILPKSIARARRRQIAGWLMVLLVVPYYLVWPVAWIYASITRLLMSWTGDNAEESGTNVTEEDIEYLVELGARAGNLGGSTEKILQSAFEYKETSVREIMVPRTDMHAMDVAASLPDILERLIETGCTRMPVFDGDSDAIIGLFYAKDLLKYYRSGDDGFDIKQYIRPVHFVPEMQKLSALLAQMRRSHVHMSVVVDEFGGTAGLVTLEDIVEEFFGEIRDEYDHEDDEFRDIGDGRHLAAARTPLDAIEDRFGIEFPDHPDYDSLGGFVVSKTGTLPRVGYEVTEGHLAFRVTEADEKRVIEVEITDLGPESTDETVEPVATDE
jgi:putative hemolysin